MGPNFNPSLSFSTLPLPSLISTNCTVVTVHHLRQSLDSLSLSLTKSFPQNSHIITIKSKRQQRCFLPTSNGSQAISSLTLIKGDTQFHRHPQNKKHLSLSLSFSLIFLSNSIKIQVGLFFFFGFKWNQRNTDPAQLGLRLTKMPSTLSNSMKKFSI